MRRMEGAKIYYKEWTFRGELHQMWVSKDYKEILRLRIGGIFVVHDRNKFLDAEGNFK